MAWRMKGFGFDIADLVGLAVSEKVIKLAAIGMELLAFVEDRLEDLLNHRNLVPNGRYAPKLRLDVRRRREVVGMDMGIDDPITGQAFGLHPCNEFISGFGVRPA